MFGLYQEFFFMCTYSVSGFVIGTAADNTDELDVLSPVNQI